MLKSSLAYTILWLLFQILFKTNCQIIPMQRAYHTATLIDEKLYILGGLGAGTESDFFSLDIPVAVNNKQLSWQDLSTTNIVPPHFGAASVKGGEKKNELFLYGGLSPVNITGMELVYMYDPKRNLWSIPKITGDILVRKVHLAGIIADNGKMYLWGGYVAGGKNGMLILDTINLIWGNGSIVGAPGSRAHYGATLLPDQKIIYMGGHDINGSIKLDKVYLYDTINDDWEMEMTSGIIPSNRDGFTATLGLDGQRVIIFGGIPVTLKDALYVLNLSNFEWSIPKISGKIPNSRFDHKANVFGNYILISFGVGYSQLNESDILLLDISNDEEYIWTDIFAPSPPPSSPTPPTLPCIRTINTTTTDSNIITCCTKCTH